jgi:hypothetical protein
VHHSYVSLTRANNTLLYFMTGDKNKPMTPDEIFEKYVPTAEEIVWDARHYREEKRQEDDREDEPQDAAA